VFIVDPLNYLQDLIIESGPSDICPMVGKWLSKQPYGLVPDIDGSVSKGVAVYTVNTHPYENLNLYSVVSIEPKWVLHHK
jgi:hypothetical protein